PSVRVWIAVEPVHMARSHDGLAALVVERFGDDPFSGNLFVFLGRRGDRCKILWWERGGCVVYDRRLERGRMRLPRIERGAARVLLDGAQLARLLDGIDLSRVTRPEAWSPKKLDSGSRL